MFNLRTTAEISFFDLFLIFFITLVLGSGLVISSSFGAKWFLLTVMGYTAIGVGLFFKDIRLYAVWFLSLCIPIVVQYKLFSRGGQQFFVEHFGGAPDEPIVNLVDLPIVFLCLLWVIDFGVSKMEMPSWTIFDTWVAVFLIVSIFSVYNTTEHTLLIAEVVRYLKYYVVYWALRTYISGPVYIWGIIAISLLVLGLQGIIALAQYFLYFQLPLTVGGVRESHFQMVAGTVIQRVTGILGHTNTFAAYLSVTVSGASTILFARIPAWCRVIVVPFVFLGSLSLVLTFSRNSWLTFALCGGMVAGFLIWKQKLSKLIVVSSLIIGIFVAGLFFGFGLENSINSISGKRFDSLSLNVINTAFARIFEDDGKAYESRWDLFWVAVEMIKENPVFGIGLNSFEENMTRYDRSGITNIIQQPVHNIYMLIAAETGIPSLMAFLVAGAIMIKYSFALAKRDDELSFVTGMFGLCTFVGLGFSNMFDVTLRKEPIIGMAVIVAALVISLRDLPPATVSIDAKAEDH